MKKILLCLCLMCTSAWCAAAKVTFLNKTDINPPGLPFSEAVRVDDTLYLSGQIGIDPSTKKLVAGGIDTESRQTMQNIQSVLNANGLTMKDIVKCTVMLADIAQWPAFNKQYVRFFSKPYPARSAFAASGLALGARVEVECIAVFSD